MTAEYPLHRVGDLADGRLRPSGVDRNASTGWSRLDADAAPLVSASSAARQASLSRSARNRRSFSIWLARTDRIVDPQHLDVLVLVEAVHG